MPNRVFCRISVFVAGIYIVCLFIWSKSESLPLKTDDHSLVGEARSPERDGENALQPSLAASEPSTLEHLQGLEHRSVPDSKRSSMKRVQISSRRSEEGPNSLPPPPSSLAPSAEPQPRDLGRRARFDMRWGQPGLCPLAETEEIERQQAEALDSFEPVNVLGVPLLAARSVDISILQSIAEGLLYAEELSEKLLKFVPSPTNIYIYNSLEKLRSAACINGSAVAYYDGNIHISGDPRHSTQEVKKSIVHEYFHHVLLSQNIHRPQWFQEGLATYAADERWWQAPGLGLVSWLKEDHFAFDLMVEAFPHTADEAFAIATYYQSYRMVGFIVWLHGEVAISDLADQLARGVVAPGNAFEQATGMTGGELEESWSSYLSSH